MAIVFDMQIAKLSRSRNDDQNIVETLSAVVKPYVGDNRIIEFHPISNTFVNENGGVSGQLSLSPKYVSIGSSLDDRREDDIDDEEIFKLTLHMYDLLKEVEAFDLALVGWEIGFLSNYLEFGNKGDVTKVGEVEGLVVSKGLVKNIQLSNQFQKFSKTHIWIPVESMPGNIFGGDDDDE